MVPSTSRSGAVPTLPGVEAHAVVRALSRAQRLAASLGPALLVVALVGLMLWSLDELRESRRTVERTYQVQASLERAFSRVKDAETAARGFLLTGEERYLAPSAGARADVGRELVTLRRLVTDPVVRARVDALEPLVARRFDVIERNVARRRAGPLTAAAADSLADRGKAVMDSLRAVVAATAERQRAVLAERSAADERLGARVTLLVSVGAVLAAALALLANVLLTRYAQAQAAAARTLDERNQQLEEQAVELEIQAEQLQEQQGELEAQQELLQDQAAELEASNEELRAANEEFERQRNAAEAARRETALVLTSVGEGILGTDVEGRITFVNAEAERLLGWTAAELLGRPQHDAIQPRREDGTSCPAAEGGLSRALRTGQPFHSDDEVCRRKDGSPLPVEYRIVPEIVDGRVVGAVVSFRDVTERRRAVAALEESEARFRAVQEGTPDGFMLFRSVRDRERVIADFSWVYANPAAERIVGRSAAALLGKRLLEEMPGNRDDGLFDAYVRVVETGAPWERELHYRHEGLDHAFRIVAVKVGDGFGVTFSDITARIRAEAALAASDARARAAFDQTAVGMGRVGFEGARWLEINDAFCRMLGYTRAEMLATPWPEFTHPDDVDLDLVPFRRMATGELETYTVEKRFLHKAGHHVWARLTLSLVRDVAGRPDYEIAVIEDITERHAAAAAVRESEARLAGVIGSAMDSIITTDAAQRVVLFNAAAERLFGVPAAEAVGAPLDRFIPARFRGGHRAHVEAFGDTGVTTRSMGHPGQVLGLRADGTEFPIEASISQVETAAGRLYTVILRDVADRVAAAAERERLLAAERVARERTERLQALTAAFSGALTPDDVVRLVVDQGLAALGADAGLVALLDPSGEWLTPRESRGYAEGVPGQWGRIAHEAALPVAEAVRTGRAVVLRTPEERARRFPAVAEALAAYEASIALPLVGRGGALGALAVNRRAAGDLGAEALAFMEAFARQCAQALERTTAYEAEQRARAEAERERAAAVEANRSKSEFLAVMSHELRTPLNAIGGHVQLVEMGLHGPVSEAQLQALARVQKAQHHLLSLINDVLSYAKLEAGKVEFDLQPTLVADVIRDVVPIVDPQVRAKGLVLDVSLPEDPGRDEGPMLVWTDRDKFAQALFNLLSNAIKFTPGVQHSGEPGRLRVELSGRGETPDVAYLRVHDTGIGIPADRQAAIFDAFVQVRTGLTREHEGTGLGLAISRDLARGMGGDLRVRSAPGEGATFTLTLRRVVSADAVSADRRAGAERRDEGERRRGADWRGVAV